MRWGRVVQRLWRRLGASGGRSDAQPRGAAVPIRFGEVARSPQPHVGYPVPAATAPGARGAFPNGHVDRRRRDALGRIYTDPGLRTSYRARASLARREHGFSHALEAGAWPPPRAENGSRSRSSSAGSVAVLC